MNGITRSIDEERRRFNHPNRELFNRRRDEIYAINEMMRQRERRRFEEYVLATQMSEERAAAMRLEEAAPVTLATAAGSASEGEASRSRSEPDRWSKLRQMFTEVVKAVERARPPTDAELEAMAQVARDAARHTMADESVDAALEAAVEHAIDEALDEAAADVGAEHVLSANGIGLEEEIAPSEVYKRAMDAAQKEFDRATKAYHRSERARLAKEREDMRTEALKRKLGLERMLKDSMSSSPLHGGGSGGSSTSKEKPSTSSPTNAASSPAKTARSPDTIIPGGFYSSSHYVC